ncbi:MAG: dipeptidase PepE [Bacteroidales bacterium]|jgi:dipeptidase E|nr:dipeptidase PepE [Bacteroidales bacterium]
MKLLLISNSTNYKEPYLGWCQSLIADFCQKNGIKAESNLLFVPYAGVKISGQSFPQSYDAYEKRVQDVFKTLGFNNLHSVHHQHGKDLSKAVQNADCIIVGGGNTFHLVKEMHHYGLMELVKNQVINGTPYIGWSAGSNIACPTLCTTNDMPIVQPKSMDALGLVPFQINPHYIDPYPEEINDAIRHGGETRMDRIREYLTVNQDVTVLGLRESSALEIEGNHMELKGKNKMVVLQWDKEKDNIKEGLPERAIGETVSDLLVQNCNKK